VYYVATMPHQYLLGLDLGTTGCKALLTRTDGSVVAGATTPYDLSTPRPLWAEQDPEEWWCAACASIAAVLLAPGAAGGRVLSVGLTGQMHGLVLLDSARRVVRPAILWNDQRTSDECRSIEERVGEDRLLALTANAVLPGFTAPKILWVQRHEPEAWSRVASVLLPKDFIRERLTGVLASDVSDASGTSLFDVEHRDWSSEMLAALDVPRRLLPDVFESADVSGHVHAAAARATGLTEGTPVVAGAGDQAAQALGAGIVEEGLVSITLGTSGVVFAPSRSCRRDVHGRLHAFCHASRGLWHLMGVMLSAGGSLRWYRDALCEPEAARARAEGRDPYDDLLGAAAEVPAGSDGLVFLPYLTGERTPYADPHARGVFCGLTVRHRKAHLTRAVIEGVSFGLRDSLDLMKAAGVPIDRVRVSGGGARSVLWRQVLADVCATPISVLNVTEGAAFGAAMLAGIGVGVFADAAAAARATVEETATVNPGRDAEQYARVLPLYRSLYAALAPQFPLLGDAAAAGKPTIV
jgi:xylulokinase